jgi:hypothetical protein
MVPFTRYIPSVPPLHSSIVAKLALFFELVFVSFNYLQNRTLSIKDFYPVILVPIFRSETEMLGRDRTLQSLAHNCKYFQCV